MATSTSATTQFTGAISGLDTASLIDAMLTAEKAPLTRIATQRTSLKATQTAYAKLKTLLASLQSAAEAFTKSSAGAKRAAASSNSTVLTATAAAATVPGSYTVVVDRLASATIATSTGAMGSAITAGDLGTTLSSLRLPGSVTAGTVGMVVDGKIIQATIGDPSTTTLGDALNALASGMQAQLQANGDAGATVTATVNANKVEFTVAGAATTHALSFGAGGTTSNALSVFGLTGVTAATTVGASTVTAKTALGVTSTSSVLDSAGLSGLVSGAGTLTINGATIAYDTTTDSLSALVTRINSSSAGITASLDRGNDKLILTSRSGGASPISITDTGTLAAALNLAPGTTDAQVLGQQAQVTVDGKTYLSDTNQVSSAITGVTLTAYALGTSTVTVSADTSSITASLNAFVSAYNTLADNLDTLTANDPKLTKGALAGESDVRTLALSLRQSFMAQASVSGTYSTLSSIGLTTGALGSVVGTTSRLQLDSTKFQAALEANPNAVADLLNSSSGALASVATRLNDWTTTGGRIQTATTSIASQLKELDTREEQVNVRVELRQAALQAKFTAMEKMLAEMQTTTNSLTSQVSQMNKSTG